MRTIKSKQSLAGELPQLDVRGITDDLKRLRANPRLVGCSWKRQRVLKP
jgi:hypothetical protein